ncbi:MAG TPA: hypothetical protein VFO76_10725 [Candidatus Kapabacteria bacterium]|nr:hypothetical protein [Candidatus Kapabacteria bacterium]
MKTILLIAVFLTCFCNAPIASAQTEITPQYLPFSIRLGGINLHLWQGIDSMGQDTHRYQAIEEEFSYFDTILPNLNKKDTFALGRSFLSTDTISITYKNWNGDGVYPFSGIESLYAIHFVEDSLRNVFSSFSYSFYARTLYPHGFYYRHFGLSMKNIPFTKALHGDITIKLSDSEFKAYVKSLDYSTRDDIPASPYTTNAQGIGWETDSLGFLFKLTFANTQLSKVETQLNKQAIVKFSDIVTSKIHFEVFNNMFPIKIQLYDLLGHKVKDLSAISNVNEIDMDVSDLVPGPYLLKYDGITYKVYKIN